MLLEVNVEPHQKEFRSDVVQPLNLQAEKPEGWQMFICMSRCTSCISIVQS